VLKGSIGMAVQIIGSDKIPQELIQNQDIPIVGKAQEDEAAAPIVQRNTTGIVRTQNPIQDKPFDQAQGKPFDKAQGKQAIEVVRPNGGETFCLGETIDIAWRYKGVQTVRVLLKSNYKTYDFGVMSAAGKGLRPVVSASKEGLYRIVVLDEHAWNVQDESSDSFAIKDCTE
jgi:hypothetical protein